jgi:hypothetical protein
MEFNFLFNLSDVDKSFDSCISSISKSSTKKTYVEKSWVTVTTLFGYEPWYDGTQENQDAYEKAWLDNDGKYPHNHRYRIETVKPIEIRGSYAIIINVLLFFIVLLIISSNLLSLYFS